MNKKIQFVAAIFILLFSFYSAFSALNITLEQYKICPSKDVLQWDGSIRLIAVLDSYADIKNEKYFRVFTSFFKGNTWPPLRKILSLALYLASNTIPNTDQERYISFLFFILLFPSLFFISIKISNSIFSGSVIFALTGIMVLQTRELPVYSVSAMLETQGMFFLLWVVYFLFRLYEHIASFSTDPPTPEGSFVKVPGSITAGLFFSIQGLVFTKYPYGIMLFISLVLLELMRSRSQYFVFLKNTFKSHYRGFRRVFFFLTILIIVSLLIAGKLGYMGLNQKTIKYFIYGVFLLIFIDFNYYVYSERNGLKRAIPRAMRVLYPWGIFPAATWIMLHPDRFSSILGGQFWPAHYRSSFFESLFLYAFDFPAVIAILICLSLLGLILQVVPEFYKRRVNLKDKKNAISLEFISELIRKPMFSIFFLIWIQFIAQELFSPNKQDRHIFHMLPSILFISSWSVIEIRRSFKKNRIIAEWVIGLCGVVCTLFLLYGNRGLFSGNYAGSHFFCYTGRDPAIFKSARWAAGEISSKKKYIVLNFLHNGSISSSEFNPAIYIDLLLRVKAIGGGGILRNDSVFKWKEWREFDHMLVIAKNCNDNILEKKIMARAEAMKMSLELKKESQFENGNLCLREYALSVAR